MIEERKLVGRERIKGTIIFVCLLILVFTIVGIRFLDVKITNIELVDQGLYNIVTSKGSVTVSPSNIIRIERTFTKAAITGVPIELDKIYTDKGFIYFSSSDQFAKVGQAIANSVDFYGLSTWARPNTTLQTVQPYAYAIGTPKSSIPVIFLLVFAQYLSLTIGGITLFTLISPISWRRNHTKASSTVAQESNFTSTEEEYGVVAK
ncbi:MAG: hypothetical protein PHZ11_07750 [Desulfitobacteriaceae bacterium]|nr:hypothetical protein [Desulfitobacteriaceae bacterium]MDD4346762.1 hypothetical protein [Desulfitobacteriaceae bacterium]MDD4401799.1 hypothetical protein [Desulfitobacteriaceae bacterium]